MAWSYKIEEIISPSLTQVRINFMVKNNGVSYTRDGVTISPSTLIGTNAEKLAIIKSAIEAVVAQYSSTYNAYNGLQQYVGTEVIL